MSCESCGDTCVKDKDDIKKVNDKNLIMKMSHLMDKYITVESFGSAAGIIKLDFSDGLGPVPRAHYILAGDEANLYYYPGFELSDDIEAEANFIGFLHGLGYTRAGLNAAKKMNVFTKVLLDAICRRLVPQFELVSIHIYCSVAVMEYFVKDDAHYYNDFQAEKLNKIRQKKRAEEKAKQSAVHDNSGSYFI